MQGARILAEAEEGLKIATAAAEQAEAGAQELRDELALVEQGARLTQQQLQVRRACRCGAAESLR